MVHVPPMSACAELMTMAAAAAVSSSKGRDTADDSVVATEVALDAAVGDEQFPAPYQFVHLISGALIYAAGERLGTLSWCVAPDLPHVMSVAELSRAAAEAAALAAWLGADLERGVRLQRMLGVMTLSHEEEKGISRLLDLESPPALTAEVLQWGQRRGISPIRPPNRTELLHQLNPTTGRLNYRRLSSVAHSMAFAVIGTWLEIVEAQESNNLEPVQIHTWMMALAAAEYTLISCLRRAACRVETMMMCGRYWPH